MIDRLISLLGRGEENATSLEYLSLALGMGERAVRGWIEKARISGIPITSNSSVNGYFLPANEMDVKKFKQQQLSRIEKIQKGIDGVDRWLRTTQEQA